MSLNSGKQFEQQFKKSVPEYCFYYRIKDSTGTFSGGDKLRFSSIQPCDAFLFDGKSRTFYALELKSTKGTSFSFEDINADNKQPKKMIHKHQIMCLKNIATYSGTVSGFVFNFRDEKNTEERTYFQNIYDFEKMIKNLNKKSFNESDLLSCPHVVIHGIKQRVHYKWDIDGFLHSK